MAVLTNGDIEADWRIYRLELIFLNPEEFRWQVFQHWPLSVEQDIQPSELTEEAVYRTQAQELLRYTYETVASRFADPEPVTEIRIHTGEIWNKMLGRVKGKDEGERTKHLEQHLRVSEERIREICEKEGIPQEHVEIVGKIKPGGGYETLDARKALDLVSALHVAHDWDIWGRLAFPSPEKSGATGIDGVIPINPARFSSFSYVIHYPGGSCDNILGYPVYLICASGTRIPPKDHHKWDEEDWKAFKASREKFGELARYDDYFKHCNEVNADQCSSYRLYGHLIDPIAQEVANDETIYIRCFPLRICGYDHFLQVLLKPVDEKHSIDRSATILPPIFSNPSGGVPELVVLKECLREMIVQMHIAAFQRATIDQLVREQVDLESLCDESYARDLFAQHAPNLVRMDRMWVDHHAYAYLPDEVTKFDRWSRVGRGQKNWREWPKPTHGMKWDERNFAMKCGIRAHVPWQEEFDSLAPLLSGTGKMRLEEQWDWLMRVIERRRELMADEKEQRARMEARASLAQRTDRR